jgi:hypothetical protein
MSGVTYLFEPEIKMPHSDFRLFVACNNADRDWVYKQSFYKLKNELLEKYADAAGYDRQIVKHVCNVCRGTGWYSTDARCRRCIDGVYAEYSYILKRYALNGQLFHRPVERADGPIVEVIKGIIKHNTPDVRPGFAYACLLKKYKPADFNEHLRLFRSRFTKSDWKKWGEIAAKSDNIITALATWHEVAVEVTDDLPF